MFCNIIIFLSSLTIYLRLFILAFMDCSYEICGVLCPVIRMPMTFFTNYFCFGFIHSILIILVTISRKDVKDALNHCLFKFWITYKFLTKISSIYQSQKKCWNLYGLYTEVSLKESFAAKEFFIYSKLFCSFSLFSLKSRLLLATHLLSFSRSNWPCSQLAACQVNSS